MNLVVPREIQPGETRVALTPDTAARLGRLGAHVTIETGAGRLAGFPDEAYAEAGATIAADVEAGMTIAADRQALLQGADLVLRVRKPPLTEVPLLKRGAFHVSLLDPFNEPELVRALAAQGVSAISMEFIPRTTRAQKMDVISSQANLGGYEAVILAARYSRKIFPMMTTAAGTIFPARVFIIGVGVAGLQAIATARRLGAKVIAYDPRPVVEEQVKSLGAQFLRLELGATGQTKDGYAQALTAEQIERQRAAMTQTCADADVVITTAQVFGKKAPLLVTKEMLAAMQPGSVVVDLAVESGGNVEGVAYDRVTVSGGVQLIGLANLPGRVPTHASQVYAANLAALVEEFWDPAAKVFAPRLDDEIIKGCLVTHGGRIVSERLADRKK